MGRFALAGLPRVATPLYAPGLFLALGVFAGYLASTKASGVVVALAAVPFTIWLAHRHPVSVLLLTVTASAWLVDGYQVLRISLGPVPLSLPEIGIASLLAASIADAPFWWPEVRIRRFVLCTLVFFGLASAATLIALQSGAITSNFASDKLRNLSFILVTVPVATLLRARDRDRFFTGLLIIAAIGSSVACIASMSHLVKPTLDSLAPNALYSPPDQSYGPLTRTRLPGLTLSYVLLLPALTAVAFEATSRNQLWRIIGSALMVGAILVSFNRNMFLGLLIGSVVTYLVLNQEVRQRLRRVATGLLATLVLCITLVLVIPSGGTSAIATRAETLLSPSSLSQTDTVTSRQQESRAAVSSLSQKWLTGIGPGGDYGIYIRTGPYGPIVVQGWVHNQYLEIGLYYGVLTFAAFVFMMVASAAQALRASSRSFSSRDKALAGSILGSLTALALSAVVGTYFTTAPNALATGVLLALPFTLAAPRRNDDSRRA